MSHLETAVATTQRQSGFGAILFAAGGFLALLPLILPGRVAVAGEVVAAVVAFLVAGALWTVGDRIPRAMIPFVTALATVLATAVIYFTGFPEGGAVFFYLWVSLFSAYFLTRRQAGVQLIAVAVAYAALLASRSPGAYAVVQWFFLVGSFTVAAVLTANVRDRQERLVAELADVARIDYLTGLLNRRGFVERFDVELGRSGRTGEPFTLALGDLDWFKRVNDELGHEAGDRVLKEVAAILSGQKRASDVAARLGGEEFALLYSALPGPSAREAVERTRSAIEVAFADAPVPLTISFGIATLPTDGKTLDDLLRVADERLYEAKDLGRDRSVGS